MLELHFLGIDVSDPIGEGSFLSAQPGSIRVGFSIAENGPDAAVIDAIQVNVVVPYDLTLSIEQLRAEAMIRLPNVLQAALTFLKRPQ